jgi:hypothetical protein
MEHRTELKQHQEGLQASSQQNAREFSNIEELLRHDAANNPPPDGLAARVDRSIRAEPQPVQEPWWRKLFGLV